MLILYDLPNEELQVLLFVQIFGFFFFIKCHKIPQTSKMENKSSSPNQSPTAIHFTSQIRFIKSYA